MNPSTDFTWSAINNMNLFLGAAFFDISAGNTLITGNDPSTHVIFGTDTSLSFTATNDLILNSLSLDIDVNLRPGEARGNFLATVTGNYLTGATSYLFESNGDYTVTSPVTTSTVGDYFRILAVKDVQITSPTVDIDTENTYIGTRSYIAGDAPLSHDVTWSSDSYTINADGNVVFTSDFNTISAPGTHDWTADSFTVNNHAFLGLTSFSSVEDYIVNPATACCLGIYAVCDLSETGLYSGF